MAGSVSIICLFSCLFTNGRSDISPRISNFVRSVSVMSSGPPAKKLRQQLLTFNPPSRKANGNNDADFCYPRLYIDNVVQIENANKFLI